MLMGIHRQIATADGLDAALDQLLGSRHAAMQRAGVDVEALLVDPRGASGGLDDIDLLTRASQLKDAQRFPDLLGLSTAAALDRFQALQLWPAHTVRELRRARFQLRQIESYRELAAANETLRETERQELDKALAIAMGATDRRDMTALVETPAGAVSAAFAQLGWR